MSDSPHPNPLPEIGEDRPSTLTPGASPPDPLPADATQPGTVAFHPSTEGGHAIEYVPPQKKMLAIPGYEVLNLLGRGGMGVVYRARQIKANRLVALKMIRSGSLADEGELARFRTLR